MQTWWLEMLSMAFALFLLMDPIGNIPIFISVLKEIPQAKQRRIILRELLIALAIIVLFNFIGEGLLNFLKVSMSTTLISGGIILFLIALKMVFPGTPDPEIDQLKHREPFIVPLAVPLVAGPAVLAAVMLYSGQHQSHPGVTVGAIVISWVFSTLILLTASLWKKLLGPRGLIACERLMGLILTLIAIQMFLEGTRLFLNGT